MICRIEQVLLIEYIYYRSLIVVGRQISLWKVIPVIPIGKDMKIFYPFFLFPPKYKLDDYIIHKGDTISFFIDNDKNGNYIKSDRFFPGEGHSFESDEVIYTEGLVVNGKEIASPLVAAFIRTPLTWLGNVGVICFYLWMCLFVIDFGMWYNKKNIDKKIKEYFYNQNMFIR